MDHTKTSTSKGPGRLTGMQPNERRLTPLRCARKVICFTRKASGVPAGAWCHPLSAPATRGKYPKLWPMSHQPPKCYKVWIKIRFKLLRFIFNGQQFEIVWIRLLRVKDSLEPQSGSRTSKLITSRKRTKTETLFDPEVYWHNIGLGGKSFSAAFCLALSLGLCASYKFHFYGYWYHFCVVIYWFDIKGSKFSRQKKNRKKITINSEFICFTFSIGCPGLWARGRRHNRS